VHDGTDAPDARETPERTRGTVMPITEVDSIVIPDRFVAVAGKWYSGQGDMLYAVCSTGGLTLGTIRPLGCDTPEQWYLYLWRNLAADIMFARRDAEKACNEYDDAYGYGDFEERDLIDDCETLRQFEDYADNVVATLEREYGLEDWEESDG
jgi:hypothetical protein